MFPVEFDLCFGEKVFTYKAVSYEEKKRFLTALISLSDRTQMSGVRKISLNNLPADLVLDESNLKNKVDQDSTNKVSSVVLRISKIVKQIAYNCYKMSQISMIQKFTSFNQTLHRIKISTNCS